MVLCRYLFLEHVKRVGEKVVGLGRTPIIWDDMLRTISKTDIMYVNQGP